MALEIRSLTLGVAATNSYILGDTDSGTAVVIDPVDRADLIQRTAEDAGWTIKLILATHAHFDHVLGSRDLVEITGAPFWTHANSTPWLEQLPEQGQRFGLGRFPEAATPDRLLGDEPETITRDGITLETIFTPGHAPDHLCYFLRDAGVLFGGDTLFNLSIGRTDLPGADHEQLMRSIMERILPLGDDVRVLPGHMAATTVGFERQNNPFILAYLDR